MKIVIDIDEKTYRRIQALVNADYFEHDICGYSMQRIANGTPYEDRPKGEWIIDGHHYKCSRCGKTLAIMFSETDNDDLIGCPFCLADMRGGRE